MTEIQEHLLKRPRAAGSKSDGSSSGAPEISSGDITKLAEQRTGIADDPGTPALSKAIAVTPHDLPPQSETREAPFILAAQARKKMPMWAMFLLGFVPLWAVSFGGTMQLPDVEDALFAEAAEIYSGSGGCAGCHGAGGAGTTVGYQLSDGSVVATFPNLVDQMVHVSRGSDAIKGQAYGALWGDARRVAGTRGQMPAASTLTQIELELVVFHERVVLSGEDVSSDEWSEYIADLRARVEAGEGQSPISEEFVELLLACADPEITPEATGEGVINSEGESLCPGPHLAEE